MRDSIVGVGIVGLGKIAERAHLPHFAQSAGCRLVGVSSSRPRVARAMKEQYGVLHYFPDWRDLVASDEIDAVAICTPNDTHAVIALAALRHKKHVLVEKPIATRLADAARMVALARAERRILEVHHHLRFHPWVAQAKRLILRGVIGRPVALEGIFCHRGPKGWAPRASWFFDAKRVGGGVLMDLGVHAFDLLAFWSDDSVKRVSTLGLRAPTPQGGRGEHHAMCSLEFRRGAVGAVTVSWRDSSYRNRWYVMGDRGTLEIDLVGDGSLLCHRKGAATRLGRERGARDVTAQEAFIQRIRGCRPAGALPAAQGDDGLAALEIALASSASLRTRSTIELPVHQPKRDASTRA
jgi:predicted dehydrogenase